MMPHVANDQSTLEKRTPIEEKTIKYAKKLLWQNGYDGMSLNDLVKQAGISKGGLFHYFPNKQTIVSIALKEYFEEHIMQRLHTHLNGATNAMSVKVALMNWLEDTHKIYHRKGFKEGCMLGNLALETSDYNEDMRETTKSMLLSWENALVSYLRPVQQEGKMLMDARQFSRLLIAMFQGITMTCKTHRDSIRASRDFQALAEYIERMIVD